MRKPKKVSKRRSKKVFAKTAMKVSKKNFSAGPMRGGIRL